jgi:hypothetical protein
MFANSPSDWFHRQVVHKGVSRVTPVTDVYRTFGAKKRVSRVLSRMCLGLLGQSGHPGLSRGADDPEIVRTAVGRGGYSNSRKFPKIGDKYNIMLVGC